MVETLIIIDYASFAIFLVSTVFIFYMLAKYLRGMRTPPFWLYLLVGFVLITLHGVLTTFTVKELPEWISSVVRLGGNLAVLLGVYKLYRAYSSKIKFDREKLPDNKKKRKKI